jgi:hypothetical protein
MSQSYHKTTIQVAALVSRYGFELKGVTLLELIEDWSASYSVYWIRLAIIEALYQGRYKTISVEQILRLWKRRGQPTFHFTRDFERLVDGQLSYLDPKAESETLSYSGQPPLKSREIPETREILIPTSSQEEMTTPGTTHSSKLEKKVLGKHESLKTDLSLKNGNSLFPYLDSERSIHQFVPDSDSSELYSKLIAVAHQELAQNSS